MLPGFLGTLPILDELAGCTTSFIQARLSGDSDTVRSITNMAVFSLRMSSPLGRNAHFCCARLHSTLDNINNVNRNTINQRAVEQLRTDDYFRVSLIRELLQVRSGGLALTGLEFSHSDVTDTNDLLAYL
jgi:hypothetical protein